MSLHKSAKSRLARRPVSALDDEVSDEKMSEIVRFYVEETPTAFNSESTRAIAVIGEEHKKIWDEIAYKALEKKLAATPEVLKEQTSKLAAFAAGYATVLYFVDGSKYQCTSHADGFEQWADHLIGTAQMSTRSAFALGEVGGKLQYYNPLIGAGIEDEFNIPRGWCLIAQLVIGAIAQPAPLPEHAEPDTTEFVSK